MGPTLKLMPQNIILSCYFPTTPHMNEKLIGNPIETLLNLMIEFNSQSLHRIGRCYPLNLFLWKYFLLYWLSSRRDVLKLFWYLCKWWNTSQRHRSWHCFSSHYYVRFGCGHLPNSARVSKNYNRTIPLKWPLFSLI